MEKINYVARNYDKIRFREQYKKVTITFDKDTNSTRRKAQILLEKKIQKKLEHIQDGTIKKGVTLKELKEEWLPVYKTMVKENT